MGLAHGHSGRAMLPMVALISLGIYDRGGRHSASDRVLIGHGHLAGHF